jgi:CheY-like chemotaxis protein
MTWLIAEDDRAIRDIIVTMCEIWGLDAISFENGDQVASYLSDERLPPPLPDVALLDIRMPGLWGHEVGALIRQHPAVSDIAIILMTAYELGSPDEAEYRTVSDADAVIYKPLPPMEELLSMVEAIIEKRKARTG